VTDIGPHLLGRLPSPPDARDYRLKDFLRAAAVSDAQLRDEAVAELHLTTVGYINKHWTTPPAGTHWAAAEALLAQIGGAAPPPPPPAPVGAVTWADAEADLDQGQTGHCVGFGWAQWGNTLPIDDKFSNADGDAIYYECKVIDGEPQAEDGSNVRSGAQAMQNRKRLSAYAFAGTIDEAVAWVLAHGPIVMGTDWLDGMFTADAQGFVTPTGAVAGGHSYALIGYDPAAQVLEYLNSWGAAWGKGGHFFMHKTDAETLFASGGEACAAVELA
jgi:Papain family cysteine protease